MKLRQFSVILGLIVPVLGLSQTISIFDSFYRIEAGATSGASTDYNDSFSNLAATQSYFNQVDANAAQGSSSVHSWASVFWNCTSTDLDLDLVACWDSFDFGDGNSGHMLSRAILVIELDSLNAVSTTAQFDQPNSWAEIDIWNGSTWIPFINRTQISSYSGVWGAGYYRLWAERVYDPIGNSTVCPPWQFNLHAQSVPEPSSILVVAAGAGLLFLRRRRQ